jgi:hypothetical protein
VLGAFAPQAWWEEEPAQLGAHSGLSSHGFFGFGGSCVFAWQPEQGSLQLHKWSQSLPPQLQYLKVEAARSGAAATALGMGGGGSSFALLLDEALCHGTTGQCAAFASPALVAEEEDGKFLALDVELWAWAESDEAFPRPAPKR